MIEVHELKTWPMEFEAVMRRVKRAEFRRDDRGFDVGDWLRLREWDPIRQEYTGRDAHARVTHIVDGGVGGFGIPAGYVMMSIVLGSRPCLHPTCDGFPVVCAGCEEPTRERDTAAGPGCDVVACPGFPGRCKLCSEPDHPGTASRSAAARPATPPGPRRPRTAGVDGILGGELAALSGLLVEARRVVESATEGLRTAAANTPDPAEPARLVAEREAMFDAFVARVRSLYGCNGISRLQIERLLVDVGREEIERQIGWWGHRPERFRDHAVRHFMRFCRVAEPEPEACRLARASAARAGEAMVESGEITRSRE